MEVEAFADSVTRKTILTDFSGWRREIWSHKKIIALSVLFFLIAASLYFISGRYTDRTVGGARVSDIILDNIPAVNLGPIFTYGFTIVFLLIVIYPLFFRVTKLHTTISQISLLILVRSFFVILTHLQAPAGAIINDFPSAYNFFIFGNDLFFSGHTAVPFLGFLIFRKEKMGIFFLIMTFVLAATVLLMHAHYSIDVFAAFFITYGSYRIGNYLINRVKD